MSFKSFFITFSLSICFLLQANLVFSQNKDENKSVQIYAEVSSESPHIILRWDTVPNADNYVVYRKAPEDMSWGTAVATYDGSVQSYLDEDVEVGMTYEYRVTKILSTGGLGYGYIYVGIEVPPIHQQDAILILVDSTYISEFGDALDSYEESLQCNGWTPVLSYLDTSATVESVKSKIVEYSEQDQYNFTSVLLVGNVPVPYSGNIGPDGHSNHIGAWPSDAFYGDIDGTWTDVSVTNTTASSSRNHNVPGDGKFDQSVIASDIEWAVGRVDFSNLPVYGLTEGQLIKSYLEKNVAFRSRAFQPKMRGLIENNFSGFDEGFGQNGLKNFSTLLGPDNYGYEDFDMAEEDSYIWAYGCGGGTYTSASGISNSSNLAADSVQAVFTMLFGSYFGDWDSQNNFMRSALGSGTILSCSWSARPNWQYHPLGVGNTLGDCALLTQNNPGFLYSSGFGNRQIHVALMGDPSLTMYIVPPAQNLSALDIEGHASIEWSTSEDTTCTYFVYRRSYEDGPFDLLTPEAITGTSYIDSCLMVGANYEYMVRSMRLEETPSGSYYNLSQGIKASVLINTDPFPTANFSANVDLESVILSNLSENANSYYWEFGDGENSTEENPTHFFSDPGDYQIILYATNDCGTDTFSLTTTISGLEEIPVEDITIFPNPVQEYLVINIQDLREALQIELIGIDGKRVKKLWFDSNESIIIPVQDIHTGTYILNGSTKSKQFQAKIQIQSK